MSGKETVKALLQDRPIAYHPILAKAFGGVTIGLFLSQLLYWSGKGADPDGWIYKTAEEFTEETGLSRREQQTARHHLLAAGVLKEERRGLPARLYYCILWDTLCDHLDGRNVQTSVYDSPSTVGETYNHSLAEITTESTTEITYKHPAKANEVWPDWYATLYAIPGFRVALPDAVAWLTRKGYQGPDAETTAYSLKSKWPGPKKSPYKDPWATFQAWMNRSNRQNQELPNGSAIVPESRPSTDRYTTEALRIQAAQQELRDRLARNGPSGPPHAQLLKVQ